jgi:hypothetical protein
MSKICNFDPVSEWCPQHGTIEHCPDGYRRGFVWLKYHINEAKEDVEQEALRIGLKVVR